MQAERFKAATKNSAISQRSGFLYGLQRNLRSERNLIHRSLTTGASRDTTPGKLLAVARTMQSACVIFVLSDYVSEALCSQGAEVNEQDLIVAIALER